MTRARVDRPNQLMPSAVGWARRLEGMASSSSLEWMGWNRPSTSPRYRRAASTDRKSTRLNSSHLVISYAVFCLKKKKKRLQMQHRATILDALTYVIVMH